MDGGSPTRAGLAKGAVRAAAADDAVRVAEDEVKADDAVKAAAVVPVGAGAARVKVAEARVREDVVRAKAARVEADRRPAPRR